MEELEAKMFTVCKLVNVIKKEDETGEVQLSGNKTASLVYHRDIVIIYFSYYL